MILLQEIAVGVIVLVAVLYLVDRVFGVAERFGFRRNKKSKAKIAVGSRLQRGLDSAKKKR